MSKRPNIKHSSHRFAIADTLNINALCPAVPAHEAAIVEGRVGCGQCHEQVNCQDLKETVGSRPNCYDCHMKHDVLPNDAPRCSPRNKDRGDR